MSEILVAREELPTGERTDIALEAAWQIEALMEALVKAASQKNHGSLDCLVKAIGTRTHQLSCLVMSALSDDFETSQDLREKLHLQSA